MTSTGCGFPIPLPNGDALPCGTRYAHAMAFPMLCPACQAGPLNAAEFASLREAAICEGCREQPPTRTRPPWLCDACEAEYQADLAHYHAPAGDPGSRCSAGCGYCGRCGGA